MQHQHTPKSSNISLVEYNEQDRKMRVTFQSGATYEFEGVPQEVFDGFVAAPSAGSHFAAHIRPKYTGKKL